MSESPNTPSRFLSLALRAAEPTRVEPALADAYEAGALGAEERSGPDGVTWVLYLPAAARDAVLAALAPHGLRLAAPEPVPELDWARSWQADHRPVEVSARLCVHPSFAPVAPRPGRRQLVIDPGSAFGTGAHESTRLALEWVDALAPALRAGERVLDVGCGTGVLALAALALAPVSAVACDLDPLASGASRENARRNGSAERLRVFTGGLDALRPGEAFAAVFANLLRRELEPLLPELGRRVGNGAALVLSGLLERECERVEGLATGCGLATEAVRRRRDASGETWVALLMRRPSDAASPR